MTPKSPKSAKNYRTLKDVYADLKEVSLISALSEGLGISRPGFRQKCLGPQFFTATERDRALKVLHSLSQEITDMCSAIEEMPVRLGPGE